MLHSIPGTHQYLAMTFLLKVTTGAIDEAQTHN